jgi:hypothetical protein
MSHGIGFATAGRRVAIVAGIRTPFARRHGRQVPVFGELAGCAWLS